MRRRASAARRTKKERYIERAKGPRVDERDVSAINHSRDLRAAKNEEARVSVRNIRARAASVGAVKKFSMMKHSYERKRINRVGI